MKAALRHEFNVGVVFASGEVQREDRSWLLRQGTRVRGPSELGTEQFVFMNARPCVCGWTDAWFRPWSLSCLDSWGRRCGVSGTGVAWCHGDLEDASWREAIGITQRDASVKVLGHRRAI